MFVPLWLIFLSTGLVMAIWTVVWAVRTSQFDDQTRARFIPLSGLSREELDRPPSRRKRADYVGMWAMVVVGMAALGAGLMMVIRHL